MSFEANVECRPVFLGDVVMVVRVCVVEKINARIPRATRSWDTCAWLVVSTCPVSLDHMCMFMWS